MHAFINRLKEPSSWAGLAGLALLAGLSMDDFNLYVQALTGVLAFLAIVMKEAGHP